MFNVTFPTGTQMNVRDYVELVIYFLPTPMMSYSPLYTLRSFLKREKKNTKNERTLRAFFAGCSSPSYGLQPLLCCGDRGRQDCLPEVSKAAFALLVAIRHR